MPLSEPLREAVTVRWVRRLNTSVTACHGGFSWNGRYKDGWLRTAVWNRRGGTARVVEWPR